MTEHAGNDSALTVEHKSLVDALAAAQAEYPSVIKNSTNPHFNSKYADLADGMDVIRPVLGRHGIAYTQTFSVADGILMLRTSLRWGAEELSSELPIQQPPRPQDFVALTTYYRRVGLFSICGITPMGEEDDGESINHVANTQAPPMARQQRRPDRVPDVDVSDDRAVPRYATRRAAPETPVSKPPAPRRPVPKSPAQEVDAALAPNGASDATASAPPLQDGPPGDNDPWSLEGSPRDRVVSDIIRHIGIQPWKNVQAALKTYNDGRFNFTGEETNQIIDARNERKERIRAEIPITAAG